MEARIGNDKFEILMMGHDCCLTKNKELVYSSSGTGSAYVLARFFVFAKRSMVEMFETVSSRVIDKCVLESLIRDAVDTNLVTGKDAEKLKDVLSTVFWSKEESDHEKLSVLSDKKKDNVV